MKVLCFFLLLVVLLGLTTTTTTATSSNHDANPPSVDVKSLQNIETEDLRVIVTPSHNNTIDNNDTLYEDTKRMWITSNEANVAAFLQPKTIAELKEAMVYLYNNDIRPRIKCGGHSYQSDASQQEGGVTIDTRHMKNIQVDVQNMTATVQGCALGQELFDAVAAAAGNYAVIGGTHGNVGYSGYLLGGGQSSRSRLHGLAIDKVLHFRLITSEGEELLAEKDNPETADLFWALQGAGNGNFGVVVEIKLEIFPHEGIETWGNFHIPYQNKEEAVQIFEKYINSHHTLDRRMSFRLGNDDDKGDYLIGKYAFFGGNGKEEALEVLTHYLKDQLGVDASTLDISAQEFNSLWMQNRYDGENATKVAAQAFYDPSLIKSAAGAAYMSEISLESSQWIIDHFNNQSHPCQSLVRHWQFTPTGGAIKDVPNDATAFWNREAEVELEYYVAYATIAPFGKEENDQHCQDFVNEIAEHLQQSKDSLPGSYIGAYINHIGDNFDSFADRCWGGNLDRLQQIKTKYDPENFWQWQYSIPHASSNLIGDLDELVDESTGVQPYWGPSAIVLQLLSAIALTNLYLL